MNIQKRLSFYKKMLKYYNNILIKGFAKTAWKTERNSSLRDINVNYIISLCHIKNKVRSNKEFVHLYDLIELYSFKPKKPWKHNNSFWYRPDNINIRIKILKECIILTKQKIKEDGNSR